MFACTPRAAANANSGTAAQFWPKSTTSVSPGSTVIASPGLKVRTLTVPYASSDAPSTPFHVQAACGASARSRRRCTAPPAIGRISPANSVLTFTGPYASGTVHGCGSRASYTSPLKIVADRSGPAYAPFQPATVVG